MALRPALAVVLDDLALYTKCIELNITGSLFKSIKVGTSPTDFDSLKESDDPLVMLIAGKQSANVIASLAETKRLRWVHSFLAGMDGYKLDAIKDTIAAHKIPVTNARGVYAQPLAEHVVYSCLYFNRQMWRIMSNKKEKVYERFSNKELTNQMIGIIGYGNIGEACARACAALGMRVTGLRRRVTDTGIDKYGTTVVSGPEGLDRILRESDFVLNVMPLTHENRHMLTKEHFAKMRRDAVFINIGRGATTVEDDLVEAILSGTIAGAALDVFETEPLPATSRLWSLGDDKLLLTPHNADITPAAFADSARYFDQIAARFVNNGELPADANLVDVSKGY